MNVFDLRESQIHERSLDLAATAIDFDLTSAETAELDAHLATCPACARRAAALRADSQAMAWGPTLLPSSRVDAAVQAEIARRETGPRPLVLIAAAALLLMALLGAAAVGAYLLRDSRTLRATVVPTPTDPLAAVSPRPDSSPVVIGETWARIDFPQGSGRLMEAVTFSGTDLVGVGRGSCLPDFSDPTACYAAAWTAAPGAGWIAAPDQAGLEVGLTFPTSGPEKGIFDVAAGRAGLVAIGYDYNPPRCGVAPCSSGPGVWRSPDGSTWERATIDLGGGSIDTFNLPIAAIVAGPQGYVMVGYLETLAPSGQAGPAHATAWTSPNGLTWTRATDTADMDVGPCLDTGETRACGGMRAVLATASGFVAVGQARSNGGERSRPAAWTSPDGLRWTRSDAGLDFDGHLSGVTLGGAGVVAVGTICQPTCFDLAPGVAATSLDGSTWTFSPMAGATELRGVANLGDGRQVFALGAPGQLPSPPAAPQLWRSDDGVVWQLVPGLPSIPDATGFGGVDLAAADDRLVVVGWANTGNLDGPRNFAFVSPTPDASTASDPQPTPYQSPTPKCPAPQEAVTPPVVSATVGSGPAVVATRGSYTTLTCSTAGAEDAAPKQPDKPLAAHPDDTVRFTVPVGWRFGRWEGADSAVVGEGANVWPPVDLPDRPRSIEVPVPGRPGDSVVGLTVVLVSDDERSVVILSVAVLVRVT